MLYRLIDLPKPFRKFLLAFVILLSIGFFTGLGFVAQTGATNAQGVTEAYNGNEDKENVKLLKFKKSDREMLTIIHTHVLSLSFIFVLLGVLTWGTRLTQQQKFWLSIEPFISIILTFGGLFFLWKGIAFFSYVVIFSGILMTLAYLIAAFFVIRELLFKE